jgi:hypothetical protein
MGAYMMRFASTAQAARAKYNLKIKAEGKIKGFIPVRASSETHFEIEAKKQEGFESATVRYIATGWNSETVPLAPSDTASRVKALEDFEVDEGVRLEAVVASYNDLAAYQHGYAMWLANQQNYNAVELLHHIVVCPTSWTRSAALHMCCRRTVAWSCTLLARCRCIYRRRCRGASGRLPVSASYASGGRPRTQPCMQPTTYSTMLGVMNDQLLRYAAVEGRLEHFQKSLRLLISQQPAHARRAQFDAGLDRADAMQRNVRQLRGLMARSFSRADDASNNWQSLQVHMHVCTHACALCVTTGGHACMCGSCFSSVLPHFAGTACFAMPRR